MVINRVQYMYIWEITIINTRDTLVGISNVIGILTKINMLLPISLLVSYFHISRVLFCTKKTCIHNPHPHISYVRLYIIINILVAYTWCILNVFHNYVSHNIVYNTHPHRRILVSLYVTVFHLMLSIYTYTYLIFKDVLC